MTGHERYWRKRAARSWGDAEAWERMSLSSAIRRALWRRNGSRLRWVHDHAVTTPFPAGIAHCVPSPATYSFLLTDPGTPPTACDPDA